MQMKSFICRIMVLSRFGDFQGKYRKKMRWCVFFVASWYRAVFCDIHGKKIEKIRRRVLFVASWYGRVLVNCMEQIP